MFGPKKRVTSLRI